MTFQDVMAQVIEWLQRDRQVSYRALKRQFSIGDDYVGDLCYELIEIQQLAVDQDGKILVRTGADNTAPESGHSQAMIAIEDQQGSPLSYTPSHLTEKILISRSALQGERKQVTVCFADIKDSTELSRDLLVTAG